MKRKKRRGKRKEGEEEEYRLEGSEGDKCPQNSSKATSPRKNQVTLQP